MLIQYSTSSVLNVELVSFKGVGIPLCTEVSQVGFYYINISGSWNRRVHKGGPFKFRGLE